MKKIFYGGVQEQVKQQLDCAHTWRSGYNDLFGYCEQCIWCSAVRRGVENDDLRHRYYVLTAEIVKGKPAWALHVFGGPTGSLDMQKFCRSFQVRHCRKIRRRDRPRILFIFSDLYDSVGRDKIGYVVRHCKDE